MTTATKSRAEERKRLTNEFRAASEQLNQLHNEVLADFKRIGQMHLAYETCEAMIKARSARYNVEARELEDIMARAQRGLTALTTSAA